MRRLRHERAWAPSPGPSCCGTSQLGHSALLRTCARLPGTAGGGWARALRGCRVPTPSLLGLWGKWSRWTLGTRPSGTRRAPPLPGEARLEAEESVWPSCASLQGTGTGEPSGQALAAPSSQGTGAEAQGGHLPVTFTQVFRTSLRLRGEGPGQGRPGLQLPLGTDQDHEGREPLPGLLSREGGRQAGAGARKAQACSKATCPGLSTAAPAPAPGPGTQPLLVYQLLRLARGAWWLCPWPWRGRALSRGRLVKAEASPHILWHGHLSLAPAQLAATLLSLQRPRRHNRV